jgi:hypothetical protein
MEAVKKFRRVLQEADAEKNIPCGQMMPVMRALLDLALRCYSR